MSSICICGIPTDERVPGGGPLVASEIFYALSSKHKVTRLNINDIVSKSGNLQIKLDFLRTGFFGYDFYMKKMEKLKPDLCIGFTDYDFSYLKAANDLGVPVVLQVQMHWLVCPEYVAFDWKNRFCEKSGFARCTYCHMRRQNWTNRISDYNYLLKLRNFLEHKRLISSARLCIALSKGMKDALVRNGVPEKKTVVINPGVDIEKWSPSNKGNKNNVKNVVFYSRCTPEKGIRYFVMLAERFRGNEKVKFISTGSMPDGQVNISFVGWIEAEKQIIDLIKDSYLVVVPSIWEEPFGLVASQAMACGKPVVAFNTYGLREQIIDGYNGFLVENRNFEMLYKRVKELLDSPSLNKELGDNARKYAVEHFDKEKTKSTYLSTIDNILSQ